jgi:hypothetical protein
MPSRIQWIVCERTSRWAAALRVGLARRSSERRIPLLNAQIYEVRSLSDLEAAMNEHAHSLGLVEVRNDNLGSVLELIAKGWRRGARLIVLLDADAKATLSVDALTEAGALAVVESPRHIDTALRLADRFSRRRPQPVLPNGGEETIASVFDRARAALPWQNARRTLRIYT